MNGSAAPSDPQPAPPMLVPETIEESAALLCELPPESRVRIIGGGTRLGIGHPFTPDTTLSTSGLDRIVDWEPDDLTVVVEAGMTVEELEYTLGTKGQTALLHESPGAGTVGGALATATSGWRRYRYGPITDRVLEVTLVSSDGRVATAGGRLVKNVTGYDIPRLATGSLGALGLIARVCLKLWPLPVASATVAVESAEEAVSCAFRPLAVLETEKRTSVFLGGTPEEIEGQAEALGGSPVDGLDWPQPPPGETRFSVRVPPSHLRSMVGRLAECWRYVAQFGVGEMAVGADRVGHETLEGLRAEAESVGGALVLIDAPDDLRQRFDPWGTPPASLAIQRRLVNLFDPGRMLNPGVLPGRI
ncbi:MAG: FAD-binding protein [bacterium]|nr:FAD-binding protein [bacterium]MDE0438358.1 FAD-binding protein [bacterium]